MCSGSEEGSYLRLIDLCIPRVLRVELAKNVLGQLLVALAQLQERDVMHRYRGTSLIRNTHPPGITIGA